MLRKRRYIGQPIAPLSLTIRPSSRASSPRASLRPISKPRENVFTFHAWKALGRSVKKGEHGVKVVTFIERSANERDPATGEEKAVSYRQPHVTTVFHISQTEPTSEREARQGNKPRRWSGHYYRAGNGRGDYIAADRWNETHS